MPKKNQTNASNAAGSAVTALKDLPKVDTTPVEDTVVDDTAAKTEKKPVVYADPIVPLDKVVYPFVCVTVCGTTEQHGMQQEKIELIKEAFRSIGLEGLIGYSDPLTTADAQGLIGWEVEQKGGAKFKDDWIVKDYYGNKVRLHKNIRNRPIYAQNIESIVQDILMRRWELNGETVIISEVGNVLDGQHTLIGLCIAQQRLEYEKDSSGESLKWVKYWPDMVVSIPKIIVYGIKGNDAVVNTMNTCRPRSFADVLYRSSYFADLPTKSPDGLDRQTAAKVTDHAVREIWHRTLLYNDGYSAKRTNSEGVAWLESHGGMDGKFLEYVRKVLEEDVTGHISKYIQCGKAVALMWIGACGKSDAMKYYSLRNEDHDAEAYMSLKWGNWKSAVQFWIEFGDREPDRVVNAGKDNEYTTPGKTRGPLKALTDLLEELNKSDEPMIREKDFLIARAWNLWLEEKPITMSMRITDKDYTEADKVTGVRQLKKERHQKFGEIDYGMDRIKQERATAKTDPKTQAEVDAEIERLKSLTLEDMKNNGVLDPGSTSGPLANLKSGAQQDCETLQAQHPELQVVAMKTTSGKMEVWGSAVGEVANLIGVTPSTHPNDHQYLKFDVSEWESIADKVNVARYAIGLGDRVEGVLQVVMSAKPANPKTGTGHKKR